MPVDLARVEEIFADALNKAGSEERAAYLDQACGDDVELRRRVEQLLAAHDATGNFLKLPEPNRDTSPYVPVTEGPKSKIGPYKLLEQIGEGGMGVVFMAEQNTPIHRTIALKIIKPGMDTRQVIARFEAERQALAMMDHPNIARVIDAGMTDTGRPYFVMDLVKGVPITDYCDQQHLSVRQRLELFTQVCHAVQHAHQKGIIHRDLKPSNVLVAEYDGKPVPKVIDFGVAKATAQRLTERTMFTQFGQIVGTFEYMSPEQARFNQLDVDTRSDIYSLGVLLYELLAGSTPLEKERLRSAAFDEILRLISEEDPPRPSTRLSSLSLGERAGVRVPSSLASIAANRQSEPAKLSKELSGELDWIAMKCLEKDRNRRYETANGLVRDIERYLHDEAVQACPPSAAYRFRKFARRNKAALGTGVAIIATLTLGTVVSTWQAIRATRAEAVATASQTEAEVNFQKALAAVDEMLTQVGQESLANIPQMEPVRRALLEKALQFYQGFLRERSDKSEIRLETGRAYRRVSDIYYLLGQHRQAEQACSQAVSIFEELEEQFPESVTHREEAARSYYELGSLLVKIQPADQQAEAAFRQALALYEALAAEYPNDPRYRQALANSFAGQGRRLFLLLLSGLNDQAEVCYKKAVELHQELCDRFPASPEYRESLGNDYNLLAELLQRAGRPDQAERFCRDALLLQTVLAADAPEVPTYRRALALSYYRLARLLYERVEQAEPHFREAAALQEKLVEDFPAIWDYRWDLARTLSDHGELLASHARPDDAKEQYARAAVVYAPTVPHRERLAREYPSDYDHAYWLATDRRHLGWLLKSAGRPDEALVAYRKSVDDLQRLFNESPNNLHYVLAQTQLQCAELFALTAHPVDAAETYRRAGQLIDEAIAKSSLLRRPEIANWMAWHLATTSNAQFRDSARAVALARRATEIAPEDGNSWNTLGVAQYRAGDWPAAIESLTKSMELRKGGDSADWFFLAMAHWQLGHKDEAGPWYDKAVEWMDQNQSKNEELLRFRAEATELLGITVPKPAAASDPPSTAPNSQP